jgi:AcrR family transcriptional regulator
MGSLRGHKQLVRDAIIEAALALFADRGFDNVTVTDIAERAGVGRTTFFRYFGDKQEVLFPADEDPAAAVLVDPPPRRIGESLPAALAHARTLVLAYLAVITESPERYVLHEELVERHPELQARSLVKQRRYVASLANRLTADGAEPVTAGLAAEVGLACYYAGRELVGNDPHKLGEAVAAAFDRVIGSLRQAPAR